MTFIQNNSKKKKHKKDWGNKVSANFADTPKTIFKYPNQKQKVQFIKQYMTLIYFAYIKWER